MAVRAPQPQRPTEYSVSMASTEPECEPVAMTTIANNAATHTKGSRAAPNGRGPNNQMTVAVVAACANDPRGNEDRPRETARIMEGRFVSSTCYAIEAEFKPRPILDPGRRLRSNALRGVR